AGGFDIFVAKYSAAGSHLWSKRLGGTGDDFAFSLAVDGSGNVVVAGYFPGVVNFGGGPLTSAGLNDLFVAKYTADGSYVWAKRLGGAANDRGAVVAVDGSGNVLMSGFYEGTVDFGGGPMTSYAGGDNVFVAKYSAATGAYLWSKVFIQTSSNYAYGIAADSSG